MDPEFKRFCRRLIKGFIVETASQLLDDKPKSKSEPKVRKELIKGKRNA